MKLTIEVTFPGDFPEPPTELPSWEIIQRLIWSAFEISWWDEDATSKDFDMVRCSKEGANYRSHGTYHVTLRNGAEVKVSSEGREG